jgi:triphosphatase
VEVELKQGQAADLFKLAKTVAQKVPVQLAVNSKADRGCALLTPEKAEALKPPRSRWLQTSTCSPPFG